jgi:glycerol-3-phosphate dehydrogenase (NAD+)
MKNKVCIVGSGNWGSAIAIAVGVNAAAHPEFFERQVQKNYFSCIGQSAHLKCYYT